jgi:hypothetical protein
MGATGKPGSPKPIETTGGQLEGAVICKLRSTSGAAAYVAFPDCAPRIVQVPIATSVTVSPLTVHTETVCDENVTGNPDDAVALTVKGLSLSARSLSAPNVIV